LKKLLLFLFGLSGLCVQTFSQVVDLKLIDYSKPDSIALVFPKKKNLNYKKTALQLTRGVNSEHEKFRVIFRWITDNIEYNLKSRTDDSKIIIKTKIAVCMGFSSLLENMCKSVGIECVSISGYSKQTANEIGKRLNKTDHSWNAVKLYGKWYLVDVTWATSYRNLETMKTVKRFDDTYFLADPAFFVIEHLPENSEWQLMPQTICKETFSNSPVLYSEKKGIEIVDFYPKQGIIKLNQKDTLVLQITTSHNKLLWPIIKLEGDKNDYYPKLEQKDSAFYLKQKFDKSGTYLLTLYAYNRMLISYKVVLE